MELWISAPPSGVEPIQGLESRTSRPAPTDAPAHGRSCTHAQPKLPDFAAIQRHKLIEFMDRDAVLGADKGERGGEAKGLLEMEPFASAARALPKGTHCPCRRIDCATVELGLGHVLFAGGCGAHPHDAGTGRDGGFYKSVVAYDSLADEWSR